jgi:hypothetical protein
MIDTEKANIYIGKFMGLKWDEDVKAFYKSIVKDGWTQTQYFYPKYHSCWDDLMSVVAEIELIAPTRVIIDCNECRIVGDKRFKVHTMKKINSVYMCVLQFIEWYEKHQREIKS